MSHTQNVYEKRQMLSLTHRSFSLCERPPTTNWAFQVTVTFYVKLLGKRVFIVFDPWSATQLSFSELNSIESTESIELVEFYF